MPNADLVDRLAALPNLAGIPRAELAWLAAHGRLGAHPAGTVVAPRGKRVESLWVILSGCIGVRVDRGAGPRRVIEWRSGEVAGMLPYSRMTGPPGDNYLEEASELLTVGEGHFPEMIHQCPVFTAYTVHLMLDRARGFNASDLQDEKMISLGKLAAGLAHELNNPASATMRCAKLLLEHLKEGDASLQALRAAGLTDELFDAIQHTRSACQAGPIGAGLSAIERADREDEISDWLVRHRLDPDLAASLADTAVTVDALGTLARAASGDTLDAALRWITASCGERTLALDIEQAATRIYDLVAAVKRFTYMDNRAGPEFVDVEAGLRDTIGVLGSKTTSKTVGVTLDIDADLPRVRAVGGELNQVWFSLIDNALDAVAESGRIDISARREVDRVVVRVVDDGPGIPPDVMPQIFDPFFTTKPPGQGTGLGLNIARRLLRRHHGDIGVQSVRGRTEFEVSLLMEQMALGES